MRTAGQIIKDKGPHFNFIDAGETVLNALNVMKNQNISYLIVKEKDKYAGIVSEKDYAHKIILMDKHSDTTLVTEIMWKDLPVVDAQTGSLDCMILMNAAKSRYLPVFNETTFAGVLTIHDLLREAIIELEKN